MSRHPVSSLLMVAEGIYKYATGGWASPGDYEYGNPWPM